MSNHSVIGVFCDDFRQEKSGQETIVGIMPDNVTVPSVPGSLSKLCIYVRFHLDIENKPKSINLRLESPDDREDASIEIENEVVESSYSKAREVGLPYAGLISRTVISPFPVIQPGQFTIFVSIDGEEKICGAMQVKVQEQQEEI